MENSHLGDSCNGNILINVGPTKDGTIPPIFEERLRQLGSWLGVNGEAVYKSRPWTYQNDTSNPHVWYTMVPTTKDVYAFVLKWPTGKLVLGAPLADSQTQVFLLGYSSQITYTMVPGVGMSLDMPSIPINKMPCDWVWVFRMTNLQN